MTESSLRHSHERSIPSDVSGIGETGAVVRHLAHELRQPLSILETSVYYLKLILDGENQRAALQLDKVEQLVQSMSWILADAVHYVLPAPPRRQCVDMKALISEALMNLSLGDKVTLDETDSRDVPQVHVDPGQARHMIRVLLTVFLQITRGEHTIAMSFYRRGGEAVLRCSSHAPAELCRRCEDLLLPFTPHLPGGDGFALASVQRIAEAHGGRVEISAGNDVLALEIVLEC